MDTRERAESTVDVVREKAATATHEAATLLHGHPPGHGRAAEVTETLAANVDRTSEYIREADARKLKRDAVQYMKHHPVQVIVAGLAGGYVLTRTLRH